MCGSQEELASVGLSPHALRSLTLQSSGESVILESGYVVVQVTHRPVRKWGRSWGNANAVGCGEIGRRAWMTRETWANVMLLCQAVHRCLFGECQLTGWLGARIQAILRAGWHFLLEPLDCEDVNRRK